MDAVEIFPPDGPINATVRPPGSKSITNRALPIAAVAKGTSTLTGVLKSDDTIYMIQALKQLGVEIDDSRLSDIPEESVVVVHGCDGRFPVTEADLFLGNSGTSIRFLTAMVAAAGRGTYRLDGIERMRQRPIGDLVDALRQLGVEISYEIAEGFPPIRIESVGLEGSRAIVVDGKTSSQFSSALLMAMPVAQQHGRFELIINSPVSIPYLEMTRRIIEFAGVQISGPNLVTVESSNSSGMEYCFGRGRYGTDEIRGSANAVNMYFGIESDASASSYWIAFSFLGPKNSVIRVEGLENPSLQGDTRFIESLNQFANSRSHSFFFRDDVLTASNGCYLDFSDISDTAQTMAAVAVFADSPTTITGVEHMRHKECDRVSAVVTELRKLGIECDEHQDGYTIYPGTPVCKEPIETYDDHRMAMSFALLGLKVPGIIIKDPDCVNKTYPRFWDDWAKVTGKPVRRFPL